MNRAILLAACLLAACRSAAPAQDVFDKDSYASHIQTLSSDEFEGRSPSSPGEEKTVQYLAEQFAAAGLRPRRDLRSGVSIAT